MGHPFCDIEAGATDLYAKTHDEKNIVPAAVLQSVRHAKKHFLSQYLLVHKKYPLVDVSPHCPASLAHAILRNVPFSSVSHARRHGHINPIDFDHIELRPIKELAFVENFLPYVKDRTISMLRSKVLRKYVNNVRVDATWEETRCLLSYLLLPEERTNHREYMESYIRGDWDDIEEYLVIRVVPKEMEHKVKARGFGCKSLFDRARSIIQELNVAGFLDKYSDEQAMTLDELTLIKKLHAFHHLGRAYAGYTPLFVNVDASSWNNGFRDAAVAPVMSHTLDRLYNCNIFSKTHQAIERSLIYMPDIDTCFSWRGQLGGIEGLNQDTWVDVYVHQMKACLENLPYKHYLLCKGDDLRIRFLIPPEVLIDRSIDDVKREIMLHTSQIGANFGHTLKMEDSYASSRYFAFSKNAYLGDTELPQTFRKILKVHGANNAFINTIDENIATNFSNSHSASRTGPSPLACYMTGTFWMFRSLGRRAIRKID